MICSIFQIKTLKYNVVKNLVTRNLNIVKNRENYNRTISLFDNFLFTINIRNNLLQSFL